MHTHRLALYNVYLSRSLAALAGLCTLFVFLYGIFLLMAVAHTAARSEAQRQVGSLSAHLSDMEMEYLSQQKSLTPEHAQELGYVPPVRVSTVYAAASLHALSINQNR